MPGLMLAPSSWIDKLWNGEEGKKEIDVSFRCLHCIQVSFGCVELNSLLSD